MREVAAADMMGAGKRGVAHSLLLTGLTVRGRKRDEALDAAGNMALKAAADWWAGHVLRQHTWGILLVAEVWPCRYAQIRRLCR